MNRAREAGDEEAWRRAWSELEALRDDAPKLGFYMAMLDPDRRIQAGRPVPEFEVALLEPAPSGAETISKASLEGTWYLLDFWATWCAPCVAELPEMHEVWERYGEAGNFQIVSLSFDETADEIAPFRAEEFAMPWLHTFVEDGFSSQLAEDFQVEGIPQPVLVDPQGQIVAVEDELRGDELIKTLAAHLGE